MKKEFYKLNKTTLKKLFVDISSKSFYITNNYEDIIIIQCDYQHRKDLIDILFSDEVLSIINDDGIIIYNSNDHILLYLYKEDYLKFYKSKSKQESLYLDMIREENVINCKIGIQDKNNNIFNIKECSGNKKVILEFINKYLQLYSILSFREKNKVTIKLNDYGWMTIIELKKNNLITIKEKL